MVPGSEVYGEKRISVEVHKQVTIICYVNMENIIITRIWILQGENGEKIEYRVWNPFRSKLAAAILGGVDQIHMPPGSKVLYLGAASGTTVSHVADVVGPVSLYQYFV